MDMVVVPLHHNSVMVVIAVVIVNVDVVVGTLNKDLFVLGVRVAHLTRRSDQAEGAMVDVYVVAITLHDYLVGTMVVVVMMMTFVQARRESLELHVADRDTATNPKASHTSHGVDGIDFSLQHTPVRGEHMSLGDSTHCLFRMLLFRRARPFTLLLVLLPGGRTLLIAVGGQCRRKRYGGFGRHLVLSRAV